MPSMAWCDYIHVLCTFTFKRIKKPGFQPFWRCLARGLPGTFRDCCKRCVVHLLRGLGESNYFHDLGGSRGRTFSLSRMNSSNRVQIGKSKISLVQIINYLHTEKITAALIQEVSNDDDIADEIRSAAKHKQYTIHYHKPDSLPEVAIILHNSLHIRQIFKDSSLEILAVRVESSDKQDAHTMLKNCAARHHK